jgi:hypothetical protein
MHGVRVSILQYVNDDQPRFVECRLIDVTGRAWHFVEKVPVVTTADLNAQSSYPQPGIVACEVIDTRRAADGTTVVTIDTDRPWGVAAVAGETRFDVAAELLTEIDEG